MTSTSTKSTFVMFLLLGIALVGLSQSAHAQKVSVPMKIQGTVTPCDPSNLPAEFPTLLAKLDPLPNSAPVCFTDVGTATHLGRFTTVYAGYTDANGKFVGAFVLTAADGSQIYGRNQGTFGVDFTSTWSGGTKRFKHIYAEVAGPLKTVIPGELAIYEGVGTVSFGR